jgi:hypothetical protein
LLQQPRHAVQLLPLHPDLPVLLRPSPRLQPLLTRPQPPHVPLLQLLVVVALVGPPVALPAQPALLLLLLPGPVAVVLHLSAAGSQAA